MTKILEVSVRTLNQVLHAIKFGIKVHKNGGWNTDLPLIKIGDFQFWDFGGMCSSGCGISMVTKSWLIGWGKDRYTITVVKPWKTEFRKVVTR